MFANPVFITPGIFIFSIGLVGVWVKARPPNSPIVQFDTTPTQCQAQLPNGQNIRVFIVIIS